MKPEVLILDEPTAGLDPKAHGDILSMIEKIHRVQQNSIILVSHNMGDIARLADKVLVMHRGRLALTGTPREVFSQSELLESMGLGLPPSTSMMKELKKRGVPVSTDILTMEEAEEELYRILINEKQ
jgi:energy-coupling factor transport system ATP-binding protein